MGVTTGDELNAAMVLEAEEMLRDGRIEGLVRQIQRKYPALAEDAGAAVGHAVEALIRKKKSPDRPFSYLASCAYNEIKKIGKFRASSASLDALRDATDWEPAYDEWSVEERALINETYKELVAQIATWENNNVRIVTESYLQAAYLGEPATSAEIADELSAVTGSEISADEVRTWKSRGFKRLKSYVIAQQQEEGK